MKIEIDQIELERLQHNSKMYELVKSLPGGTWLQNFVKRKGWRISTYVQAKLEADTLDEALLAWQKAQGEKK